MGLIDFVKDAGQELLKQASGSGQGAGAAADTAGLDKAIHDLGLQVENLGIQVHGDQATVSGTAASQADREKVVLVVGNTKGVARVDDQLQVAKPEPQATYYKVQSGDTLSRIAEASYGDPMKYPVIFEANRPMLKDPDKIYPGQVLRIPPATA